MSNALSRSLKAGSGSDGGEEQVSEDEQESVESKGKRVRGEKSSEDVDRSDFEETEDTGSSSDGIADKVNDAVDKVKDAVSGGSGSDSGSTDKDIRTANVSSENASDPKTQRDVVEQEFQPRTDEDKSERLESQVKDQGLTSSENIEEQVRERNRFQSEDFVERKTGFVESVKAEDRARKQKERIEENIKRLKRSSEDAEIVFGKGENTEKLGRDEAVSRLEESKGRAESVISQSEAFQDRLQQPPESGVIKMSSLPQDVQRDLRDQRNNQNNEIDSLPTDGLNTQYPGGTRIDGGRSQGDPLSRPEFRDTFQENVEAAKDVSVLAGTSAGFQAPFAVVDPDRTVSGVIERQQRKAEKQDLGANTLELLGSPAGVLAGGVLARGVGAGFQGGKAIVNNRLPQVASSRLASTAGTAGKVGVAAGGSILVGRQALSGAQDISQGRLTVGGGKILQVASEAGAVAKGFRSGSRDFSPQVGRTTKVEQESVLKQVADEDVLRGVGRFEARTPVTRKGIIKGETKIGEAVSTGNFKVVAGDDFGQAKGEILEELPSGKTSEKGFTAQTDVKARSGSDEVVQRTVVRTEEEGKLFKQTSDFSGTSVVRKKSENSINEIRNLRLTEVEKPVEVEDALGRNNIIGKLEADVLDQVRRGNLNAKLVNSQGRTSFDEGGVVFSDSESLVLNRRSGSAGGQGSISTGTGQSLQGGQAGLSQAQRSAVSNQREIGQRFGQASRESVEESLESTDTFVGSTEGGSSVEGSEAGIGQIQSRGSVSTQEESGDVEVVDVDTRVSRLEEAEKIQEKKVIQSGKQRGETGQVTSTASNIAGSLNDEFKATSSTQSQVQGQRVGSRIGSDVGQRQRNVQGRQLNQNLGAQGVSGRSLNVPKIGAQSALQIKSLQTIQALQSQQSVKQAQNSLISSIQVTNNPGAGGGLPFNTGFEKVETGSGGSDTNFEGSASLGSYRDLSWFSANLVEQETGQEARFPLTGQGSALNPLDTVQESTGEVDDFDVIDANRGENKRIW